MFRVVQISDTHLSPSKRHFEVNWAPLAAWIAVQAPDLVIHTGDLTVDGADHDADLNFCAELFAALDCPVRVVPGNHDIGDQPRAGQRQPIGPERRARWATYFGPDYWFEDRGGWRLIGLDSLLWESGIAAEAQQEAWLSDVLASAGQRPVALFCHKPLFIETPDEGDQGYWAAKPGARDRLFALLRDHEVRLIASGHLHMGLVREVGGISHVWGPSSAFICGASQPPMPGARQLGAVVHDFGVDQVSSRLVTLPELHPFVIDEIVHEVYPRSPAEVKSA